ncbi:hypothetical protein EU523_01945 [Candidatus Heimdallarchaeota archaeon]|nr:MAG: hypothetical protein EU523_01945 [Candidatus Heimdallarchaeota archaeon]
MLIENKSLHNKYQIFKTRVEAGEMLAKLIEEEGIDLVQIIPNGGLPVGYGFIKNYAGQKPQVDLLIVKKIHIPGSTEAGMGAITPSGNVFLNERIVSHYSIQDAKIQKQIQETKQRIQQMKKNFGIAEDIAVEGKTILIVDDGIASGFSMLAGTSWLRNNGAKKILIGAPTAPLRSIQRLEEKVEKIYCLNVRETFTFAVADAYKNWYDLSLEEAINYSEKITEVLAK